MTIKNKLDNRQSRQREKLDQVSEDLDLRLDSILNLINDELTPPIRLRADTPATRVIYVDSNTVQTFDSTNSTGHKRRKSIPPFQDKIPIFTGGSFTIPSVNGGTISGTILDQSYTLSITVDNFRKMILSLNADGKIVLSFGVQSTIESTATLPALSSSTFPIGMVVLKNEGGTIRTVSNEHIYQFIGNTNSGADANIIRVTKNNHGFVVGEVLYLDSSGVYQKANASASNTSNVVGMVSKVVDVNTFELTTDGQVSNIGIGSIQGSLVGGTKYFLSTTSGIMSTSAPTVVGQMSVELGTAINATTFAISPKLGLTVGQVNLLPNLRTQIVLNGSASSSQTTLIQNVLSYEAGEVVGWVYLNADVDYRFYIQAQFTKNAAATDFNISYQTSGETPPAGFSMNITAAGNINIVLPSMTGWVSGYLVYALNAPALGTSFPLAVNQSSVNSNYREISASTTLTDSDYMVVATGSSSLVVTLPALSGSGKNYVVKSLLTSGTVTVQTTGGVLIDSASTKVLQSGEYLEVTSSTTKWIADYNAAFALPPGAGTNNQLIKSNGDGTSSWASSVNITGANVSGLTASRAVQTDASKNLVSADFALPVGAGTLLNVLSSNGNGTSSWVTRPKIRKQEFTSNGSWTCPAGVDTVFVFGCGGGGGGGQWVSGNATGPQGGGGSGLQSYVVSVTSGNSYSITIGSGGAANGGNGGSSIFGSSLAVFLGGKGGYSRFWQPNGTAGGGDGGMGGNWEIALSGGGSNYAQNGQSGFNSPGGISSYGNFGTESGGGGGGGYTGSGGNGAYTYYAGGGSYTYTAGSAGTGYGSGGGGGGNSTYPNGYAGAPGIIIVCWVE
jgi:hypothetical protein